MTRRRLAMLGVMALALGTAAWPAAACRAEVAAHACCDDSMPTEACVSTCHAPDEAVQPAAVVPKTSAHERTAVPPLEPGHLAWTAGTVPAAWPVAAARASTTISSQHLHPLRL